jgi:hypothetical protein
MHSQTVHQYSRPFSTTATLEDCQKGATNGRDVALKAQGAENHQAPPEVQDGVLGVQKEKNKGNFPEMHTLRMLMRK